MTGGDEKDTQQLRVWVTRPFAFFAKAGAVYSSFRKRILREPVFRGFVARLNRLRKNAVCQRNGEPQRLKPNLFSATYGKLEGIP